MDDIRLPRGKIGGIQKTKVIILLLCMKCKHTHLSRTWVVAQAFNSSPHGEKQCEFCVALPFCP